MINNEWVGGGMGKDAVSKKLHIQSELQFTKSRTDQRRKNDSHNA